MAKKQDVKKKKSEISECGSCSCRSGDMSSAIYGLGFLGAAIYYISNATGFWIGALGVLKSMIWPLFIVYEVLKFLGA